MLSADDCSSRSPDSLSRHQAVIANPGCGRRAREAKEIGILEVQRQPGGRAASTVRQC
jgi:hypothetical protein